MYDIPKKTNVKKHENERKRIKVVEKKKELLIFVY